MSILYRFKRHPIPMSAMFRHSLVLTYAYPEHVLQPLLEPGLMLDTFNGFGFLAVALVDTQAMRPRGLPSACGLDSHLAGYRIFTRLTEAPSIRGLRILRSDTDRWPIKWCGNLLTHYQYRLSRIGVEQRPGAVRWTIETADHAADLDVTADLSASPPPPAAPPFRDWKEARRFAGPLPYTFDYEPETNSIIRIEAVRRNWTPRPVPVVVDRCTFLEQARFSGATPVLASAFYVPSMPYSWNRGERQVSTARRLER